MKFISVASAILMVSGSAALGVVEARFQYSSVIDPDFGYRLSKYTITLYETVPSNSIGGYDLDVTSNAGGLHQIWNGSTQTPRVGDAGFLSAARLNVDSHYLVPNEIEFRNPGPDPPAWVATENQNPPTQLDGSSLKHGYGTFLSSDLAALTPVQGTPLPIAQVVLAPNKTATFTGEVSSGSGTTWVTTDIDLYLPLGGDADMDGDVDTTDFATWATNFNTVSSINMWARGDFDQDTDVDTTDFATWANNFGFFGEAPLTAELLAPIVGEDFARELMATVPEPSSVLALTGLVGLIFGRRRSR